MASQLIEGFSGDWEPEKYEDTYTDALEEIVKAQAQGRGGSRVREPEEEEPPDLLEALRLSVEQSRGGRPRRNGASRTAAATTSMRKEELLKRAKKLDIAGRSKMSKDELAKAVASR